VFIIEPANEACRGVANAVAEADAHVRALGSAEDFLLHVPPITSGCIIAPSDLAGVGIRGLIDAVRARHPLVAVVVLGHDDDLARVVDLMRAGAAEYLESPVSPRLLRTAVRRAIDGTAKP
jgi:FixJ family two-component response regulator